MTTETQDHLLAFAQYLRDQGMHNARCWVIKAETGRLRMLHDRIVEELEGDNP